MEHDSRPPGFDMSYKPAIHRSFGPPARSFILPGIYLVIAVTFVSLVGVAYLTQQEGWLFRYIVEGDAHRLVNSQVLGGLVLLGALASLARTAMRGVVLHADGIDARYVNVGWPKVRSCSWAEINEMIFAGPEVWLALWDGTRIWLPEVADGAALRQVLLRVAEARAIPVQRKGSTARRDEHPADR